MLKTHTLGYPRIGNHRELKKACERYWANQCSLQSLIEEGKKLRLHNWKIQQDIGIDHIPCNDFSFYDHVLDMTMMVGAVPKRYKRFTEETGTTALDLYFAMARGYQKDNVDLIAMEMTKWFDTNYHYIVPEFDRDQCFEPTSRKALREYKEAKEQNINAKPVMLGPISYLLLGKEKEPGFHRIDLLDQLIPVYIQLLRELQDAGAIYVQIDEPFLVMDLDETTKEAYRKCYGAIRESLPGLKIILTTYFGGLADNAELAVNLPIYAFHLDLVRAPDQLTKVLSMAPESLSFSLGVVDGRNIWKTDYTNTIRLINQAIRLIGETRCFIAPSCSLLHVPCDLSNERDEQSLPSELNVG